MHCAIQCSYFSDKKERKWFELDTMTNIPDWQEYCKKIGKEKGGIVRFRITAQTDEFKTELLPCWFAVYKADAVCVIWEGMVRAVTTSRDEELQKLKELYEYADEQVTKLKNEDIICYQKENDVRFIAGDHIYVGTLNDVPDDWKEYIYL